MKTHNGPTIFINCQGQSLEFSVKHKRHYMHSITLPHQLIVSVTTGYVMVRSSRLILVGHVTVLDEVDNFHNLSKIVS